MPKVSSSYLNMKKEAIINAAAAVLKNKPMYEIEMKDIIKEAGLSQGGIYRYFAGLDEILVEVINISSPKGDYRSKIDEILAVYGSPDIAIQKMFAFLGNYMLEADPLIGKIQFELTVMFTSQPDRAGKLLSSLKDGQSGQYFMKQLCTVIEKGISDGYFSSDLPKEDICSFISASIDGIVLNLVLRKNYASANGNDSAYNADVLLNVLAESVLDLLNRRL